MIRVPIRKTDGKPVGYGQHIFYDLRWDLRQMLGLVKRAPAMEKFLVINESKSTEIEYDSLEEALKMARAEFKVSRGKDQLMVKEKNSNTIIAKFEILLG